MTAEDEALARVPAAPALAGHPETIQTFLPRLAEARPTTVRE